MCNDVKRTQYSSLGTQLFIVVPEIVNLLLGIVVTGVSPGLLGGSTNSDEVSLDSWAGVG